MSYNTLHTGLLPPSHLVSFIVIILLLLLIIIIPIISIIIRMKIDDHPHRQR